MTGPFGHTDCIASSRPSRTKKRTDRGCRWASRLPKKIRDDDVFNDCHERQQAWELRGLFGRN